MTKAHKHVADSLIGVATYLALLSIGKDDPLSALYKKTSDSFEKIRVREGEGEGVGWGCDGWVFVSLVLETGGSRCFR